MKTFKNTKQAESEVKKLLKELEVRFYNIRIEHYQNKTYFLDADVNCTTLYSLQCLSELVGDSNPTIIAKDKFYFTIETSIKIE